MDQGVYIHALGQILFSIVLLFSYLYRIQSHLSSDGYGILIPKKVDFKGKKYCLIDVEFGLIPIIYK